MAEEGLDALLLISSPNLVYLSGASVVELTAGRAWYLLVPRTGDPTLVVQDWRKAEAVRTSWVADVSSYRHLSKVPFEHLDDLWESHRLGTGTVGAELGAELLLGIPWLDFEELLVHFSTTRFVDASDLLWRLRMVKDEGEVEFIRRACRITADAYASTFASARAGMRGRELVWRMKSAMLAVGGSDPWVLASFGPESYDFGTASPGDRPLEPGDMLWMDAGCTVSGYWSDFSRAAVVGPAAPEQRDLQRAVHELTAEGVGMIRPGRPVAEIAARCNEGMARLGAPVTIPLSTLAGRIGHGLGLDLTELPHVAEHDPTVLVPGMVITVEPGVATAYGAFHVEENVLVTEDGHEVLSVSPWELFEVKTR
jgi:Xaa-Pro dipeptidase